MWEKFKSYPLGNERVFMALVLVLVALTSFALGRHAGEGGLSGGVAAAPAVSMSYTETAPVATVPSQSPATVPSVPTHNSSDGIFVASRSGTKYHHTSCPGAKQIKPENRITFATEAAAQSAGYTRAANCSYFKSPQSQ